MKPKIIKQSGDKFLVADGVGKTRFVERDRKGIKRGDYLQPVGKDKEKFIERYGWLPNEDPQEVRNYAIRKYGNKPDYKKLE